MHPERIANIIKEGALAGRGGGLWNIVGNPLETTVFLSRLIFDGTFDKFPALKVCGAHGGGYLPSYLGRTEVACQRTGQNCVIKKKPSEYLRSNILADTMVFSEEGLRHLVAEMGVGQIVSARTSVQLASDHRPGRQFVVVEQRRQGSILGGTLTKLRALPRPGGCRR
jgi:aminocarboxymuconate-semialdehyde decarboxylase